MKKSNQIVSLRFVTLALLASASTNNYAVAQGSGQQNVKSDPRLKVIRVYFPVEPPSEGPELKPLRRQVDARSPLRPAIEALVAGPTSAEAKEGYVGVAYGDLRLASVKLARGVARIDFTREIRSDYNPGDLQTLRFQEAVMKTAKQFPSVKKVIVCVNGMNEFGIGLVLDAPVPCRPDK
jgi:spore germination protein GerM